MSKIKKEYVGRTDLVDPNGFFAPRNYADHELQDFHNKIQKFWDAPREVNEIVFGKKIEGLAQKFRHHDLHVAFGSARKVMVGGRAVYQYVSDRYEAFNNLWKQYEDWRQKQDWIAEQNGTLELASEVPF